MKPFNSKKNHSEVLVEEGQKNLDDSKKWGRLFGKLGMKAEDVR